MESPEQFDLSALYTGHVDSQQYASLIVKNCIPLQNFKWISHPLALQILIPAVCQEIYIQQKKEEHQIEIIKLLVSFFKFFESQEISRQVATIMEIQYVSSTQLKKEAYAILKRYKEEKQPVSEKDEKFMLEIFKNHEKAQEKLAGMIQICTGTFVEQQKTTKCFYIQKKGNEFVSISYIKSIQNLFRKLSNQFLQKQINLQLELAKCAAETLVVVLKMCPQLKSEALNMINNEVPHYLQNSHVLIIFYTACLTLAGKQDLFQYPILKILIQSLMYLEQSQECNDKLKMKQLLRLLVNYIDSKVLSDSQIFKDLLDIFQSQICKTHCKIVSWVIVHVINQGPSKWKDKFLSSCLQKIEKKQLEIIPYATSFIAINSEINDKLTQQLIRSIMRAIRKASKRAHFNEIFKYIRHVLYMLNVKPYLLSDFVKSKFLITLKKHSDILKKGSKIIHITCDQLEPQLQKWIQEILNLKKLNSSYFKKSDFFVGFDYRVQELYKLEKIMIIKDNKIPESDYESCETASTCF